MRMGLVSELRRRNVLRMLVLYVVTAWLIMQVAEVLIDLAKLPDWVGTTTLWLLAVGLPIALIFSWFYDVTPEGICLEKDVARGESITHVTGRRLDFLVISLLCAAVILFAYDKWWIGPPLEKSIAVLPFENTSHDKDSADYLAIGIQDDLVTRLSKIADLRVISRTSTERYRDKKKTARNIGKELGVSKVLEGAVQRAGNQIRVNVQLIDAVMDKHLWAATYDRDLTAEDVFAIQSEIVEAIVQELKSTLTPEETLQLATMPTRNFDAYTAYLKGRNLADIESVESLNAAIVHFKMAIELDGKFALAYVGLADTYLTLAANFLGGLSTDESNALAEPPLVQALALDSSLGEAYATLGLLRQQQGKLQAAEHAYQEAISLRPNYPRVFRLYGRLRWRQGRSEEAMELLQTALSLDPFSVPINFDVGRLYDESGHFDEALARYLQVVEIEPDHAFAYVYIAAIHYLVFGRADESLIWYQKAAENDALSPSLQAAQALAYLELGDAVSAKEWVDRGIDLGPRTFWPVWSSLLYNSYTGDDAAAQEDARILLEVYPQNSGGLRVLRNADIAAGRYEVARSRYARVFRELTEPEVPEVTTDNYRAAVDLALILMRLDEQGRANDLLEGSLKVIAKLPRLGVNGYYITDVQIFALQQRRQRALDALRQAIEDGWRFLAWYHLEQDPNLEAIRGEPEFDKLYQVVKADLAKQTKRVQDLKASGELRSVPPLEQ